MLNIMQLVKEQYPELVKCRRRLHKNPELSSQEDETVRFIEQTLDALGIPWTEVPQGGVLGFIDGAAPGKTLLMRADIDALPIQEDENNLVQKKVCVSSVEGVCHACGHDAHTAMLLTEAAILQARRDAFAGKIVLCFERGEEGTGNARYLLDYIERESGLQIDGCYATHVLWNLDTGKIAASSGAVMAGGLGFEVRIIGKGGHGARPDLANNPIDCFVAVCNALNSVRLRTVNPFDCLTFSIGKLQSGTKINVVPEDLIFSGTARFFNTERVGERFVEVFKRILEAETNAYRCQYEILHMPDPMYEVYNNPVCAGIAKLAVSKYIGTQAVAHAEPWMASETMNLYLRLYPGVMTFTGIRNPTLGSGANHHTPEFDIDEEGMCYGAATGVGYALEFLANQQAIPFERNIISLENLITRSL